MPPTRQRALPTPSQDLPTVAGSGSAGDPWTHPEAAAREHSHASSSGDSPDGRRTKGTITRSLRLLATTLSGTGAHWGRSRSLSHDRYARTMPAVGRHDHV